MKVKSFAIFSTVLILTSCENEVETEALPQEDSPEVVYQMNESKLSAVDANNLISSIQKSSLDLVDSLFQADSGAIDSKMSTLLFELDVNLNRLDEIEPLPEISPFISAVKDLIVYYQTEISSNFTALVPLIHKKDKTKEELEKLEDYDRSFVEKEAELFYKIVETQEAFAKENSILLSN